MIAGLALAVAVAVGAGAPAADPLAGAFDARIAASADAAESLQGELDGRWVLVDSRGRSLFVFQISDPPQSAAPLEAAWRRVDDGSVGVVSAIARAGRRVTLAFDVDGRPVRLALLRSAAGRWRGWLTGRGRGRSVRLHR